MWKIAQQDDQVLNNYLVQPYHTNRCHHAPILQRCCCSRSARRNGLLGLLPAGLAGSTQITCMKTTVWKNRFSTLRNVCTYIVLPRQTKEVAHNTRPHLIPRNQCPFSPLSDSLETDQNSHQHPDGVLTCHYHFGVTYHSTPNHCSSTPNLTTHYYTNSQSQLLLNSMSCWIPTWLRPWSYPHINIWRQYSYCQKQKFLLSKVVIFTVKGSYYCQR